MSRSGTRLALVVGARPEFVQSGALLRSVPTWNNLNPSNPIDAVLIHTGQHYDRELSGVFFEQLELPAPDHILGVGSASHGVQTGQMMERLDPVLDRMKPDHVVVFGDTNSTLAGALAAAKKHVSVAHVEAGLRSFNMNMPEEVNRRVTDHVSTLLFCPSPTSVKNLDAEGIRDGVHQTGDVMHEAMIFARPGAAEMNAIRGRLGLPADYCLATVHRAENTDHEANLRQVMNGLSAVAEMGITVVFPVHPRTGARVQAWDLHPGLMMIEPLGHRDLLAVADGAKVGLTDSGGLQKELYWLGVPAVTMRDETEWVETLDDGWNVLTGANGQHIVEETVAQLNARRVSRRPLYGEDEPVTNTILRILASGVGV